MMSVLVEFTLSMEMMMIFFTILTYLMDVLYVVALLENSLPMIPGLDVLLVMLMVLESLEDNV